MTRQEKNSIGLIVLVLMMMAFFALFIPMFRFSIPRVFMHDWLGMGTVGPELHFTTTNMVRMIPLGLMYVMWAAVSVWVYRDAERRRLNGLLWSLFVFVGNIIGLIIYLILRGSSPERTEASAAGAPQLEATRPCPSCGAGVQADYVACPYCAHTLVRACTGCNARLEVDWKACPHCGQAVTDE